MESSDYPKIVRDVMIEAPLAYAIVAILDFKEGRYNAKQTFANWNRHKVKNNIHPIYHLSICPVFNEPAMLDGKCDCGIE